MELIKELIEAAKVSRKSATSVYHRDYERTKNKAYRKYDPPNHASAEDEEASDLELEGDEVQVEEGAWDFIKGAAGYAGGQVKQAVGNAVQAGQTASNNADYQKAVATSKQLIGEIVGMIRKVGNEKQVLGQIFSQSQLNPQMQQRITKLISQKLQQTSVQQQ